MLQVLVIISVVWVTVLVLALVGYLGLTAFYLRRAKGSVAGIADDLEAVAKGTEPLNDLVGEVALHVGAIHDDMDAVNSGLGKVIEAVSNQPSTN
jgi:hypothetical protein